MQIVTGAGGNVESLGSEQEGFTGTPLPFSTFRSGHYGFNRMVIYNDSHMYWTFVLTDNATDQGTVADSMWMVKTRLHY